MKDLERAWMFTAGFQTSVAAAKQMESVIGVLTANRDFLKELQREVEGKVWGLRVDFVDHLTRDREGRSCGWCIVASCAFFAASVDYICCRSKGSTPGPLNT